MLPGSKCLKMWLQGAVMQFTLIVYISSDLVEEVQEQPQQQQQQLEVLGPSQQQQPTSTWTYSSPYIGKKIVLFVGELKYHRWDF